MRSLLKSKIILNERNPNNLDYGCVMLYFDLPQIFEIHNLIDSKDWYIMDNDYGPETQPHITLLYGVHNEDLYYIESLVDIVNKYYLEDDSIMIGGVDYFENEEYNILKLSIDSNVLHNINKNLRDKIIHTEHYNEYKPHITIGYLKKESDIEGYIDMINKTIELPKYITPMYGVYSYKNNKTVFNIN